MTISFPEEAVLHCRTGMMAMKAKQYEVANTSFRRALVLNPMLWEALEGLCALGRLMRTY
jgi:anaphase-promoting complex subunit 3